MNDGMSVWEQTILRQNEELARLGELLQDSITLSNIYRDALNLVLASCPVTPCPLPGDNFLSSELLAHVAHVLDEYPGWLRA